MNRTDPDITNSIQQIRLSALMSESTGKLNEAVSLVKRLNAQLPPNMRVTFVDKAPHECGDREMWLPKFKRTLGHYMKRGGPERDWYDELALKVETAFSDFKHGKSSGQGW